jgi:hypothetical protein
MHSTLKAMEETHHEDIDITNWLHCIGTNSVEQSSQQDLLLQ